MLALPSNYLNSIARALRSIGLLFVLGGLAARPAAEAQKPESSSVTTLGWHLNGTTPAANGPGLHDPHGIITDRDGTLYLADADTDTIRKIGPTGVATVYTGEIGDPHGTDWNGRSASFYHPTGVALDGAGNLYVADAGNHVIRKINSDGVVSTFAGHASKSGFADGTGDWARFSYPEGVAVDHAGNVFVADTFNCVIRQITLDGVVTTLAGLAGNPGAVDGFGTAARFSYPSALAIDAGGNIYVADPGSSTIRKITSSGQVSTLAGLAGVPGSSDGSGSAARFDHAGGITVDGAGTVFVSDTLNHTIRKITPAGAVTTVAGLGRHHGWVDGPGEAARFYRPQGLTVDSRGTLYIADSYNKVIRLIRPPGHLHFEAEDLALQARAAESYDVVNDPAASSGAIMRFQGTVPGNFATLMVPIPKAGTYNLTIGTKTRDNRGFFQLSIDGVIQGFMQDEYSSSIDYAVRDLGAIAFSTPGDKAFRFLPTGHNPGSGGYILGLDYIDLQPVAQVSPVQNRDALPNAGSLPGSLIPPPAFFVTNFKSDTVQAISTSGTNLGVFGMLTNPTGLAFDKAGNLFVSSDSSDGYLIQKFLPDGTSSVFASGGLQTPHALAFDKDGNLYVTNTQSASIVKFTPDGLGVVFADSSGGIARPADLVFDAAGNLYVTNTYGGPSGTGSVTKIAPDGTASVFANSGFNVAYGLAIDAAGNIYVSNFGGNTIRRFTSTGIDLGIFASPALDGPHGMIFDSEGNLYVANNRTSSILKFSSSGTYLGVFANTGSGPHFLAISTPPPTPTPTPPTPTPTPTPTETPTPDTNPHSNRNPNAHRYTNPHSNRNPNAHRYTNPNSDRNANTDGHTHPGSNGYAGAISNRDTDPDGHAQPDSDAESDRDTHPDSNIEPH